MVNWFQQDAKGIEWRKQSFPQTVPKELGNNLQKNKSWHTSLPIDKLIVSGSYT